VIVDAQGIAVGQKHRLSAELGDHPGEQEVQARPARGRARTKHLLDLCAGQLDGHALVARVVAASKKTGPSSRSKE